jgi:hypothetical protein
MSILFCLSFLPCVGWWFWRGENKLSVLLCEPLIAFCVYYGVFFLLGGGIIVSQEIYDIALTYSEQAIVETYVGFLVFGLCVVMTYEVFRRHTGPDRIGKISEDCKNWVTLNRKQLLLIGIALLGPAILSAGYMVRLIAQHGLATFMYNRIVILSGKGFYLLPLKWFLSYLLIYWINRLAISLKTGKRLLGIGILVISLFTCASGALQGSRSGAMVPLLYMLVLWAILRGPAQSNLKPILVVLVCVCTIVVVGVFLGPVRERIAGGSSDVVGANLKPIDLRRVILRLNNFRAVESTIWLAEHMRDKDMMLGSTFLAIATGVVPRAVWENKPLGGGPALGNLVSPGSYDLISGKNLTTYSPGIVVEGYLNFGFPGFIIGGILFGILLASLAKCFGRVRGPIGFAVWIYALWSLLGLLTAEVLGSIAGVSGVLLPMAMIYPFSKIMVEMKRGIAMGGGYRE